MIMAGGTGGHVFPALAVAQRLRSQGLEVSWLGTRQSFEARVVPEYGFPMDWVRVEGLRGNGLARWLRAPLVLTLALFQSMQAMRRRRPGVVLGMGGFVTGPGGVTARLLGIPLVIHEQNSLPGLTNRWLAHIATRVLEAFPGSFPPGRARVCGNPVRLDIITLPAPEERLGGRQGPLRLLVLGGSQGAQALNAQVPGGLAQIPLALRPEVRHQAGRGKREQTIAAYSAAGVTAQVDEFVGDMAEAYGWADLVICRAGALTVSELAAAGLGALLVPYPQAVDDHQTHNAQYLVRAGAAQLLPQSELTPAMLAERLAPLLADRGALLAMARAARALARPDAAELVAQVCRELSR
jgi:UDP-N-acetylglucosamine--N-acetylmuramyl-(pentapeptide) pyrophosphoryl-undecaprenol N-acetylglucosamine transferase